MEQENNKIFLSESLMIKSFLLLLHSYRHVFFIAIPLSVLLIYIFINSMQVEYEASIIVDKPSIFENHYIVNKYNFMSKQIAKEMDYSGFNSISNDSLFNLFLKTIRDKKVVSDAILELGLVDEKNYISKLDYQAALRKEINKVQFDYKDVKSFEKLLWERGSVNTNYVFKNKSTDLEKVTKVMFLINDKISIEGKKILIQEIDNSIKFLTFVNSKKIKTIKDEISRKKAITRFKLIEKIELIENLPVMSRNSVMNEIEYLRNEMLIAENQGILYPREYKNDTFALLAKENKSPYLNNYTDGTIALQARIAELKQLIGSEDTFKSYIKKINLETMLELKQLKEILVSEKTFEEHFKKANLPTFLNLENLNENQLLVELINFKEELSEAKLIMANYNESSMQVKTISFNVSIALLLAFIFAVFSSFIYIFIHRILKSD